MNIKTNEQILNDYYNCIQRKDLFVKILDRESEYWAVKRINSWKHQRNDALLKNTNLIEVYDWLINLNNQLSKLINEILSELKMVFDWKQNKITIENSNLEFRLRERLQHLKELPYGIELNLIDDEVLAFNMQQYCNHAFNLMIHFVKSELLIDIESLPSFYLIQEVRTNVENSIDFEKIKFITETRKAEQPQQSEKEHKKEKTINAPTLALFCNLINEIGIDKKEESENVKNYCERICEKYGFLYTDRVRQNFSGNKTKKNRKEFAEKVLPLLDVETKSKIDKHLDSKDPSKQNLYA